MRIYSFDTTSMMVSEGVKVAPYTITEGIYIPAVLLPQGGRIPTPKIQYDARVSQASLRKLSDGQFYLDALEVSEDGMILIIQWDEWSRVEFLLTPVVETPQWAVVSIPVDTENGEVIATVKVKRFGVEADYYLLLHRGRPICIRKADISLLELL